MPFLDSPTIRPLYDVRDGGPPVGFRCMLGCYYYDPKGRYNSVHCGCAEGKPKVTRTLAGMRTHQRIVHGIKEQESFNFEAIDRSSESV